MALDQDVATRLRLNAKGHLDARDVSFLQKRIGEEGGTYVASGMSAGTFTRNPDWSAFGFPTKGVYGIVKDADILDRDMLMLLAYKDAGGNVIALQDIPGLVIEDCEDDWTLGTWGGSIAGVAGATNKVEGAKAVRFVKDGSSLLGDFMYEDIATADLTDVVAIAVWITTDDVRVAGHLQIGIASDNTFTVPNRTLVDVPAQAAATTKLHIIDFEGAGSAESVGIVLANLAMATQAFEIDAVRLLTQSEKDAMEKNIIAAGTVQNTEFLLALNTVVPEDQAMVITDAVPLGGTSGDKVQINIQ